MTDKEKKGSKILGYSSQDDGGPGGKAYPITEESYAKNREIYKEIFGSYPDEDDKKKEHVTVKKNK